MYELKLFLESHLFVLAVPAMYAAAIITLGLCATFVLEDRQGHDLSHRFLFFNSIVGYTDWEKIILLPILLYGVGGCMAVLIIVALFFFLGLSGLLAILGIAFALYIARFVVRLNRKLKLHMGDKEAHK